MLGISAFSCDRALLTLRCWRRVVDAALLTLRGRRCAVDAALAALRDLLVFFSVSFLASVLNFVLLRFLVISFCFGVCHRYRLARNAKKQDFDLANTFCFA